MTGLAPPDRAPRDGPLPERLAESRRDQPLSMYIHVPWCRARCGYCDFNTSVLPDDGPPAVVPGDGPPAGSTGGAAGGRAAAGLSRRRDGRGARPGGVGRGREATVVPYLRALEAELALAARVLGPRPVTTVYFGGGTPTLLTPDEFQRLLTTVAGLFALDSEAEVTVEANPETVTPDSLARLRATGVNRLSLGMQSAVPHVLSTLDRRHTPGRAVDGVGWARRAGFDQVSLDLIYGTPGESVDDWVTTLDAALAAAPDHVSAYALIVEEGTPLAARLACGELTVPDDDETADKYVAADERFEAAGLPWYELSNWGAPCRHNVAYWVSADWWGLGAGAHSHVSGVRWWNRRRPLAYAAEAGWPVEGREILTPDQRHTERILLELRLRSGLDAAVLRSAERRRAAGLIADGLLAAAPSIRPPVPGDPVVDGLDCRVGGRPASPPEAVGDPVVQGLDRGRACPKAVGNRLPARLALTLRGRLLADAVTRDLID